MKNFKKKGFTIVELVIVIAVIAILSAVLIPTFSSLIKKANLANDQSMIRNMNTTLATSSVLEGGFESAGEAIDALNANGFTGKYTPYSSKHYYGFDLEDNKMYLINEAKEVIYPDDSAEVSELWFIWNNNAIDKVSGASKYVSFVNISGEGGYYAEHFGDGNAYTLDLNGHFISVSNELTNVTAINGVVISGASKGEGVVEMENAEVENVTSNTVIENKVFNFTTDLRSKVENTPNVTYKNCYFYNWEGQGHGLLKNNVTFEKCVFIDAASYIFNIQSNGGDKSYEGTFTVKDCTFTNCARVFNIPLFVTGEDNPGTIIISGNTFNPVSGPKRSFIQLMKQTVSGASNDATRGYLNITISDNNFTDIGSSQAGLITLHESIIPLEGISAEYITFANNKFADTIAKDKYVVNDDGKLDSEFENYNITEFKNALIQKIK